MACWFVAHAWFIGMIDNQFQVQGRALWRDVVKYASSIGFDSEAYVQISFKLGMNARHD